MADESAKKQKRIPGKAWKPGQSGNPKGRPKKGDTVTEALRAFADNLDEHGLSARDALAERLWKIALKRNDATGVAAIKYIYDRLDGTPRQTVEHSGSMDFRILLPGEEPDVDD